MKPTGWVTTVLAWVLLLLLAIPCVGCRTTRAQQEAIDTGEPPEETGSDTPRDPEGPKPKPKPPEKPL